MSLETISPKNHPNIQTKQKFALKRHLTNLSRWFHKSSFQKSPQWKRPFHQLPKKKPCASLSGHRPSLNSHRWRITSLRKRRQSSLSNSYRIHGTGIFTYIYQNQPNVGKFIYLPTFTIKINPSMLVNIPVPWILWDWQSKQFTKTRCKFEVKPPTGRNMRKVLDGSTWYKKVVDVFRRSYLLGFLWEWYGNSMGPAYHKGVPLLGVPGITLEYPLPTPAWTWVDHFLTFFPQKICDRFFGGYTVIQLKTR